MYALVAESVDALDLESSSKEWEFKSLQAHHSQNNILLSGENYGPLAQLAEQPTLNRCVRGSIPRRSTI